MPLRMISMQLVSVVIRMVGSDILVLLHGTEVGKGSGPWQELAVRRACAEAIKKMKYDREWIEGVCDCRAKEKSG